MMGKEQSERHIIWSDIDLDLNNWREDLKEEYPDKSDDELYEIMIETNGFYLDDERANLDIKLPEDIIVIADLGLWNGRHKAYKDITSGNIKDCLYSNQDYNEWYIDKYGDLRADGIHHDGTNHYLYRVYKEGLTETQKENFKDKIFNGVATWADITRLTNRLGDEIGKVYGWDFAKPKIQQREER